MSYRRLGSDGSVGHNHVLYFWHWEAHVIFMKEINCGPKKDVQSGIRQLIMSHYM